MHYCVLVFRLQPFLLITSKKLIKLWGFCISNNDRFAPETSTSKDDLRYIVKVIMSQHIERNLKKKDKHYALATRQSYLHIVTAK
jgi:hypothetical protein